MRNIKNINDIPGSLRICKIDFSFLSFKELIRLKRKKTIIIIDIIFTVSINLSLDLVNAIKSQEHFLGIVIIDR